MLERAANTEKCGKYFFSLLMVLFLIRILAIFVNVNKNKIEYY
jgi:hypothetical protein